MNLIVGFAVIIFFILASARCGFFTLGKMSVSFGDKASTTIAGLFFVELLGLLCYISCNLVTQTGLWVSFLPFLALFFYQVYQNRNKSINIIKFDKRLYYLAFSIIVFLVFYAYLSWTQLQSVILDEGVIYQDVIYHAGISNAFFDMGYPIKDVQYAGGTISYHIFTHFVVAQLAYLSGLLTYKVYVLFFTPLSIILVCSLIYSISKFVLKERFSGRYFLLVSFISLFGANLMGLGLSDNYFSSFFFSYSYQWQLIIMLLIANYVIKSTYNNIVTFLSKDYLVLLILVCVSIIIKGSSLPLLLAGFGLMFLVKFIVEKKINIRDVGFLALTTFVSVLVYLAFFTTADGADFSSFIGFNNFLTQKTLFFIVAQKIGIQSLAFVGFGLLISVISFRYFLVYYVRKPIVSFVTGMFITGIFFFLFYSNNPNYFLIPTIFMSNFILIIYLLVHQNEITKFHKFLLILMFMLSVYPISSVGFRFKKKLAEKAEQYYPINHGRLELYSWIENNTPNDAIIFTPSVYATDDFISDNYYPAAISKRVFYLGGFRFGNPTYAQSFKERELLVNNFSLERDDQMALLRTHNIAYVMIEKLGNKLRYDINGLTEEREDGINNYQVLFKNKEGLILRLK